MDTSVTTLIEIVLSFVKEGSALFDNVMSKLNGKRRDDAIRNLRRLHFGPRGLLRWTDKVIAKGGLINTQDIEELSKELKDSTEPISKAIDQLSEFVFEYEDLKFSEFENLLTYIDGKTTLREGIQKIIDRYTIDKADTIIRLDAEQLTSLRKAMIQLNTKMAVVHDSLVEYAKQ